MGYEIPDDCVFLFFVDQIQAPIIGYKEDSTKVIIYDKNGYDVLGYDKNGYDAEGKSWREKEKKKEAKEVVKISKLKFNREIISEIKENDEDGDGYLDEDEISNIDCISSGEKVKDVSGIEYFTNLTELSLEDFQGSKIDLRKNRKCKIVEIKGNHKAKGFTLIAPSAKKITVSFNGVKSVDVSGCTKVIYLFIQDNRTSHNKIILPKKNNDLRYIYTWGMSRTKIDLNKYKNLQVANILAVGNDLTEISANKCKNLEFLRVHTAAHLKSFSLKKCKKLRYVYMPGFRNTVSTRSGVTKIFRFQVSPKKLDDRENKLESKIEKLSEK